MKNYIFVCQFYALKQLLLLHRKVSVVVWWTRFVLSFISSMLISDGSCVRTILGFILETAIAKSILFYEWTEFLTNVNRALLEMKLEKLFLKKKTKINDNMCRIEWNKVFSLTAHRQLPSDETTFQVSSMQTKVFFPSFFCIRLNICFF